MAEKREQKIKLLKEFINIHYTKITINKLALLTSLTIIVIYLLPIIILKENAVFRPHDNLDSIHVDLKILTESNKLFSSYMDTMPILMYPNLTRVSYPSEYNLVTILFYVLGPLNYLIFERIIMTIVGYVGILNFSKNFIITSKSFQYINYLAASCFAILPFHQHYGIRGIGLPLFFNSFLKIRNGESKIIDQFTIFFFVIYTSFVRTGIFALFICTIVVLWDLINKRFSKLKAQLLTIFSSIILYLLIDYRFILITFNSEFVSHRSEFGKVSSINFIEKLFYLFNRGSFHAQMFNFPLLNSVIIMALICIIFKLTRLDKRFLLYLISTSILIIFISVIGVFLKSDLYLENLYTLQFKYFPLAINRFDEFLPFLWIMVFSISTLVIANSFKFGRLIAIIFLISQNFITGIAFGRDQIKNLIRVFDPANQLNMRVKPIRYKEWFSYDQFKEIRELLEKDSNGNHYKVASIGLHPSIVAYNNIPTIDGYSNFYSLEYKKEFRKILNKLYKNPRFRNKKYFDNWGNRLYLFIDQPNSGTHFTKSEIKDDNSKSILKEIDFIYDLTSLRKLGCNYIISTIQIKKNNNSNALKLIKNIDYQDSIYDLWVYKIL